jgi:hypothetical protein
MSLLSQSGIKIPILTEYLKGSVYNHLSISGYHEGLLPYKWNSKPYIWQFLTKEHCKA